jgi:hypothetical protein
LNDGVKTGTNTGDGDICCGDVVGILLSKTCGNGKYPSFGCFRCLLQSLFLNIRKKSRISSDDVVYLKILD